jgi:hypothetical protein
MQTKDMQAPLNNASDKTEGEVSAETGNDRFTELHLKIQNIEDKLLCKVNLVMDEIRLLIEIGICFRMDSGWFDRLST